MKIFYSILIFILIGITSLLQADNSNINNVKSEILGYINNAKEDSAKGEHDNAILNLNNAINKIQTFFPNNSELLLYIYMEIAKTYNIMEEYEKSLNYLNLISTTLEKYSLKNYDKSIIYIFIAENYLSMGEYQKTLDYLNSILTTQNKSSLTNSNNIMIYNLIAITYSKIGEYQKALEYLNLSLKYNEESKEKSNNFNVNKANIYLEIAKIYQIIGDYEKSLDYNDRSFKINQDNANQNLYMSFNYKLYGAIYTNLGNYEKAIENYEKAIKIEEELLVKNYSQISLTYNDIGIPYWYLKNYDKALEYFHKSLKLKEEKKFLKDYDLTASTYNNIGLVYLEKNEYKKSINYFNKALEFNKSDNHQLGSYYSNIAIANRYLENYNVSIEYFNKGLQIFEKSIGKNHPNLSLIHKELSLAYQLKKEYKEAYLNIRKAYDIFLHNRDKNFLILDNSQKENYLKKDKEIISTLLDISYEYMNIDKEVSKNTFNSWLNTKGSIFDSENSIAILYENSKDEDIKFLIETLSKEKRELAKLYQSIPKDGMESYKNSINLKEKTISDIEQTLSKKVSSFKSEIGLKEIDSKAISKLLKDDELYIDYAYTEKNYYIFTIDKNGLIGFYKIDEHNSRIIDNSVHEFHKYLESFYKETIHNDTNKSKEILKILFTKALHEPIGNIINNYKTFIISTDGALRLLPFEAMINFDNKYLIENKNISYIPSGKEFIRLSQYDTSKNLNNISVFANPDFNFKSNIEKNSNIENKNILPNSSRSLINKSLFKMHFSKLPGTEEELHIIRKILDGNITEYSNINANESNLLKVSSPKILHIATHGFFLNDDTLPNPMLKSGIALSSANFSAKNGKDEGIVTSLKLSGLNLKGTELVVLSACETGVVDINSTDNVSGLNKAFIQAGASNVIMSLWAVSDKETKELMSDFYENTKITKDYALALKSSKLNMIKKDLHPYYWAPFIISGKSN